MTKAPISLQELRRRIYLKAKSDKTHRFWGIYTHIAKMEVLREAYEQAKKNGGAPGIDGTTFAQIEELGVIPFLEEIRNDLTLREYKPQGNRAVEIPKSNGKTRTLQIPCIRDRVVQGALKFILEPIFEADFCDNSYGFRPKRSPHRALAEVRRSLLRRMDVVIDVDLFDYFNTIRHSILLNKIAQRIQDPDVMHLIKQILKIGGSVGVPQGGPLSPLAANIYLNEIDWVFDEIRKKTKQGEFERVNYHRFADDIVIAIDAHPNKRGWPERAMQLLREKLKPLGVKLNPEKTKMVNTGRNESFEYLGFDLSRVKKKGKSGEFILLTPKKKARQKMKAEIREAIRRGGDASVERIIDKINSKLGGWVNYFRVGNSSRAFSEIREYTEMKIRTLLTRRKRRHKTSVGWKRWSNEYLYGVLDLYWDWNIRPLKNPEAYS